MAWIDRPKHGWEGIYETDEKFVGPSADEEELSEEEQIRLAGEESDRIIRAMELDDLYYEDELSDTSKKKFRPVSEKPLNHQPVEETQLTPEQIATNEIAMQEARERAKNMSQMVGSLFRR